MITLKKSRILLYLLLSISFSLFSQESTIKINIEGMHCAAGCAMYIENELNKMDGVVEASIDFNEKMGEIKFNNDIKKKDILKYVNNLKSGAYNASISKNKTQACSKGKTCCQVTGKKNKSCDKKALGCCSSSKKECSKSKK